MTALHCTQFLSHGVRLAAYERGRGQPIVFLHGLCGDIAQVLEAVPDTLQLHALEARGHGRSELGPPEALSLARFTDDLAAFIAERCPGPVVLGGISMGAALSLRLAVTRPELVAALVLVRPAWISEPAPANLAPNREVGALLARYDALTARARFTAGPSFTELCRTSPDNLNSLLGFFARVPQAETAALLSAIAADGPGITRAQIAALALPTLVLGTAQDAIHPEPMARQLVALIPGARYGTLTPKAQDKPAYLSDLHTQLSAFLKEL